MSLSIVIVNWNTLELLLQCIASIYRCPPEGDFEILVVDNGSQVDPVPVLQDHFPGVQVTRNAHNLGFAKATNQGILRASGDHILLLNPDTVLKPGALSALQLCLKKHANVAAVGAHLLNPDGSAQPSCYPAPNLLREAWRLFHLDKVHAFAIYPAAKWDKHTSREVEVLQGTCLMLKRKALATVGILDEAYFMYSEEVDLCHRLRKAGWRLLWVPTAEVIHYGGQSTRQNRAEMFRELYKSKIHYFRKNHGLLPAGIYKSLLVAASLARLCLVPFAYSLASKRRQEALDLAERYWRLLGELPRL